MTRYYDEYEEEWHIRAREDWREDPARKAAWAEKWQERIEAFDDAYALVQAASARLLGTGIIENDSGKSEIYRRVREAVLHAEFIMKRDSSSMEPPNDCGLGNMAAFAHSTDGWPPR